MERLRDLPELHQEPGGEGHGGQDAHGRQGGGGGGGGGGEH